MSKKPIVYVIEGELEITKGGHELRFVLKADKPVFLAAESAQTTIDALADELMIYYAMDADDWSSDQGGFDS